MKSLIWTQHGALEVARASDGWLFDFPLCPSTNGRMVPSRGFLRLSNEARDYETERSKEAWLWKRKTGFKPIDSYTQVELWFILPRRSCDCHNYFKVFFDTLEKAELVTDDRFLVPLVRGLWHDSSYPRVIVKLPDRRSA